MASMGGTVPLPRGGGIPLGLQAKDAAALAVTSGLLRRDGETPLGSKQVFMAIRNMSMLMWYKSPSHESMEGCICVDGYECVGCPISAPCTQVTARSCVAGL